MTTNIYLRFKIHIESINQTSFRGLYVSDSVSIGELITEINTQLARENLQGDIYFMFNELQTDMVEESRLGSILFPEDVLLFRSIIENGSLLFIKANYITPPTEPNVASNDIAAPVQDVNPLNIPELVAFFQNMMQAVQMLNTQATVNNLQDVVVGLDTEDLDKLKVDTYSNFPETKSDVCSVCIDSFLQEDTCRELNCGHLFHKDCIDHWLTDNINCPVCRTECGKGVPRL